MTNECKLAGRLSAAAEEVTFPSGDVVVIFRLIVTRPDETRVDTFDCRVDSVRLRRRALALEAGTHIAVEGCLHRRFWRTAHGPASRYEVQVNSLSKLR